VSATYKKLPKHARRGHIPPLSREKHASCRAVALAGVGGVDRHNRGVDRKGVDSIYPDVWLCLGCHVVLLQHAAVDTFARKVV